MKRYLLIAAGLASLLAGPVRADDMKGMKHDNMMCNVHCSIMDLEKQVGALKSQASMADKAATKEHLKKDIEAFEKKLQELKKELEAK